MLTDIINELTKEQRIDLFAKGITSPVMSMWRNGKRRPTYSQCVYLSEITNCDLPKLLTEIALNEVPEETAKKLRKKIRI